MLFLAINKIRKDLEPKQVATALPAQRAWLQEQVEAGNIQQAGRWGAAGEVFLFEAYDQDSAEALMAEAPFALQGVVVLEVHPWHIQV